MKKIMRSYYYHAYNEDRGANINAYDVYEELNKAGYNAEWDGRINCNYIYTDAPADIVKGLEIKHTRKVA